jgi:hypothetical protein
MKRRGSSNPILRNLMLILDVLIALLIVITAFNLSQTQFGKAALTFGIIMLGIVTILAILRRI